MQIASAQTVRAAEQAAFAAGLTSSSALMDAVVERLARHPFVRSLHPEAVVVYAGRGNNAGDAIGLAARLGLPVVLRAVGGGLSAESQRQMEALPGYSTELPAPGTRLLLLDGLLGSGAHGRLRAEYAEGVREMNALRSASPGSCLLAVDIPTGLDAESGTFTEGEVVLADATAAIGCVKPGMLADAAQDAVGRLLCIPLPEVAIEPCSPHRVLDAAEVAGWLPRSPYSCFKNRRGRVTIVAGSIGMLGAAELCARAAVHAGAGLVVAYALPEAYPLLAVRMPPEVMVRPVASYADIAEPQADALVIGPGLGSLPPRERTALRRLAADFPRTVVLDADGLNLAAEEAWDFPPNFILTPHPGEMRRLDPLPAATRLETVQRFLARHDCTLLLKGCRTVIADRRQLFYNSTGGPFMANGGQGDVLSGAIAALAACGLPPLRAAALAAYLCGLAAESLASPITPASAVAAALGCVIP